MGEAAGGGGGGRGGSGRVRGWAGCLGTFPRWVPGPLGTHPAWSGVGVGPACGLNTINE